MCFNVLQWKTVISDGIPPPFLHFHPSLYLLAHKQTDSLALQALVQNLKQRLLKVHVWFHFTTRRVFVCGLAALPTPACWPQVKKHKQTLVRFNSSGIISHSCRAFPAVVMSLKNRLGRLKCHFYGTINRIVILMGVFLVSQPDN